VARSMREARGEQRPDASVRARRPVRKIFDDDEGNRSVGQTGRSWAFMTY
jgi:hypothetical protein